MVEHFCPLCAVLPTYRPFVFFAPLLLNIAPKKAIPPTLRTTALDYVSQMFVFSQDVSFKKSPDGSSLHADSKVNMLLLPPPGTGNSLTQKLNHFGSRPDVVGYMFLWICFSCTRVDTLCSMMILWCCSSQNNAACTWPADVACFAKRLVFSKACCQQFLYPENLNCCSEVVCEKCL